MEQALRQRSQETLGTMKEDHPAILELPPRQTPRRRAARARALPHDAVPLRHLRLV